MKRKYYTVAMRKQTYLRLKAYTRGGATFDQVLKDLLDMQPVEEVTAAELKEIEHRFRTFQGRPWSEVRKSLGLDK